MPFHWHKEWEIIYVKQGSFPVYVDGILHTAAAGEMTVKKVPVRNAAKKVGPNDPCPCGSGKKYKKCCMQKEKLSN